LRKLLLAGALLAALLVPASSALAVGGPYNPTGEYAQFDDCPLSKGAALSACLLSESSAGEFMIGKKTVPLVNPVVLQAGVHWEPNIFGKVDVIAAEDGNTLVPTPQPVPGGLLGITAPTWWPSFLRNLFNETINNGFTGVTATVELAAPASSIKLSPLNLAIQEGTALGLPAKIKLSNPFLGSNCYIGSSSNPVMLNFTSGTTSPPPPNEPITGDPGEGTENEDGSIVTFSGGRLVDNSYAAPGAKGCGGILFSWAVDPFVNSIVGVPSPAGTNTAILEGKIQIADPAAVKASE
jgi:hypothetical protein